MKALNDILTGKDNETHDFGRWLAMLSILVGLGLEIYVVVARGEKFDMMAFGGGIAALVTGVGVLLKLKKDTEP
jgi:hypothetical protein